MAKFAKVSPKKSEQKTFTSDDITETLNEEGGKAYTLPYKERLATRVMSSLINEKKFYGDNTAALLADIKECGEKDPEFLMKLAAYTRNVMYFRSSPVFVLGHASLINEVKPFVRKWTPRIVQRADEPAEILASFTLGTVKKRTIT